MTIKQVKEFFSNKKRKTKDSLTIGIDVSFAMGWQKRSSGRSYDSRSRHAFLIGCHTQKVISQIIYSKNCRICANHKKAIKQSNKPRAYLTVALTTTIRSQAKVWKVMPRWHCAWGFIKKFTAWYILQISFRTTMLLSGSYLRTRTLIPFYLPISQPRRSLRTLITGLSVSQNLCLD